MCAFRLIGRGHRPRFEDGPRTGSCMSFVTHMLFCSFQKKGFLCGKIGGSCKNDARTLKRMEDKWTTVSLSNFDYYLTLILHCSRKLLTQTAARLVNPFIMRIQSKHFRTRIFLVSATFDWNKLYFHSDSKPFRMPLMSILRSKHLQYTFENRLRSQSYTTHFHSVSNLCYRHVITAHSRLSVVR